MKKKKLIINILIVTAIFLVGFFVRLEYVNLPGIPDEDKEFYLDEDGLPYMFEFGDSYYNYRLTKNFLDHGYLGDTKINNIEWDLHSYYPPGVPMEYPPLLIYITAYTYKTINFFSDVSLMKICFYIPAFIGPIAGIIAYFFARRFINLYGAAIAGLFTVISPFYVIRTLPGFFDTDIFLFIFPLSIAWLYIEALQNKNLKKQIIFAVASSILMFFFSLAWTGWVYLFYLIIAYSIGYLIFSLLKKRSVRNISLLVIAFIFSFLLISIFIRLSNINKLIFEPSVMLKMLDKSPWLPWPNSYSVVSESQKHSLPIVLVGIGIPSIIGVFGIIWMARILISRELTVYFSRINWIFFSFLLFWTLTGVTITALEGYRFNLLAIPPIAISSGVMIGILIRYPEILRESGKYKIFNKRRSIFNIISLFIILILIAVSIHSINIAISCIKPRGNDDLWEVSEWIKDNTHKETVVISNWSDGHLFTAIAERPVIFDGRMGYLETISVRKNNPAFEYGAKSPGILREYWIDRAFSTSDENLSYGILMMLSNHGDIPTLLLEEYIGSVIKSVEALNSILGIEKKDAVNLLKKTYNLNDKQIQSIIELVYISENTPFVVVTTDEIRDKANFIFNFGEWDFYNNISLDYLYSIEDYNIENGILSSSNGIEMNLENADISWNNKVPYSLEIINGNKIEKSYFENNSNFSIIILTYDKKAVVIDRKFEDSVFVKLFLEKSGTCHLEAAYSNKSAVIWE